MDSDTDDLLLPCPVCGRRYDFLSDTEGATCDRCEADLDLYQATLNKARKLLDVAAIKLRDDPAQSLLLAERSRRLHATEEARRMIMLGTLCGRDYQAALAAWKLNCQAG
ncbi:MAG TPA: hypothetical protein DCS43_09555 [Verrucomicrobia bacterium]|nr:hypothetical protein [Verrucomicrobiota bacterium]